MSPTREGQKRKMEGRRLTRGTINHWSNYWILVQLGQKFARLDIVAYLRKLECHAASSILSADLVNGVLYCVVDRVQRFAGWLAVSDGDDESRLGVASALHFGDDDSINDFLSHGCAHRCESLEANSPHQLVDLLFGSDVVQHVDVIV